MTQSSKVLLAALSCGAAFLALAWLTPDAGSPANGSSETNTERSSGPSADTGLALSFTPPEKVAPGSAQPFETIKDLEKGTVIRLPLPDRGEAAVLINYVNHYPNGAASAVGDLRGQDGIFEIAVEPWGYRGFILPKDGPAAYVYSGDPESGLLVARRPRGEVICEPEPDWKPLAGMEPGIDPEKAAIYNDGRSVGIIYEPIPILHSLPRAEAVIYLDFDGEIIEGHSWEGGRRIIAPAYNLSASAITNMWRRVAEDFAPFEVNVTTDLQAYLRAPQGLRIRCITTTNNFASAGGVAFSNTFRQSGSPVCWNFYSGNAGALVISHEVGHTFGLAHDGRGTDGYFGGHGSGATSWGPIMGAPYDRNVTQWSKGDYVNANQQQDDLLFIGAAVPRRFDDHADDAGNATPLTIGPGGAVSNSGVIASPDDIDAFAFTTGGGSLNLQFNGAQGSPNLDIEAKLYNAAGTLVTTASPANQLNASLSTTIPAGTYTVTVDGTGNATWATNGYDDYGSLGEYTITGTVPSPGWLFRVPVNALAGAPLGTVAPGGSTYSITSGNTGGAFSIQPGSGEIRVANPAALNGTPTFDLTVSYTSGTPRSVPVQIKVAPTRGLRQEIWTGLSSGSGISGLTSSASFPANPNHIRHAGTFQSLYQGDQYGQRLSGYLIPRETGNHTFWTTSDDMSELWLSTDSNSANKVRIARNTSATSVDSWTQQGTQQSAPIPLVAGQRYYIEQLHREHSGGDRASAAWQTPTLSRRLIATDCLEYPGTIPNRPPWLTNMTFRVSENSSPGTPVGTLLAGDHEAGSVLSNFTITGGNTGSAFSLHPATGVLSVNGPLSFAALKQYLLNVRVTDSGGLNTTAQIAVDVEPLAVKRELWTGISGNSISNLTSSPNFPNHPASTDYLSFFDTPSNIDNNYGQRLSGYLRAPDSGQFTFWIASDDHGELWLSTDENPANKVRIAWHSGSTGSREWAKFSTQRSAPVTLEGGKFYYIEALHKEGTGADHLAVSWQGPDFGQVILGAPHVTQEFYNHAAPTLENRSFTAFDRDVEIGTLEAKDWSNPGTTITYNITGGNADGAFAIDPANGTIRAANQGGFLPAGTRTLTVTATDNGLPSPRSGTAAITVTVVRASLKREVWTGLPSGQTVSSLTGSLYFPHSPDQTGYTQNFQAPSNTGDNYGQRLSGYLIPPSDGDYTFWIASDDGSELFLSTDANPSNKRRIAGVSGSVSSQNWTQQSGQQSAVISLAAGQRYYIEALHREGTGADHLAVAWQGPGFSRTVVPESRLEYPDFHRPALKREVWPGNPTLAPPVAPPAFTGTLFDFKSPVNISNNFSERVTGYLVPPASGDYTFWIASDDQSELRLSTDENPANLALIANVSGSVGVEAWNTQPSQKSAPVTLIAGKRYYVEALHREGTGNDHLAVAWEGPGFSRRIIGNEHLEHPSAPSDRSLPMVERWNGIGGTSVSNLTGSAAFPASPSSSGTLPSGNGLVAPSDIADNYGQRISGYLIAPEHGRYTFWIASDNSSELWLSTDDHPANRVRIAQVGSTVSPQDWDVQEGQKSAPLALEAGRRYYFEILHKEGPGNDHVAAAWEGPGFSRRLIPNQQLEHPLVVPGKPSIRREIWTGVSGESVADLTSHARYITGSPSNRGQLTTFESPNGHNGPYGQRISARLVAPESGNFRFRIAGNHACELWLSTDANPANRVLIAHSDSPTLFREWDRFPSQTSSWLPLAAGQTYYIEALHKDGQSDGRVSVAWEGPSFNLAVLDGRFLEYPGAPPAVAALKREVWTGISGNGIGNLTNASAYPNSPNQVGTLDAFEAPSDWGENYGQRVSGYLIAPRTGDYQFWIRSDDASQLWLSTTGLPADRTRIAWADNATGRNDWTNFASQTSAVIPLVAGQRCYIEALHKEGAGGDYLAVAWSGPGFARQVIRPGFLEYPGLLPGETQMGIPPVGAPLSNPGYHFWTHFTGLQGIARLPGSDPDGDGIPNSMEFVLGGNPFEASPDSVSLLPELRLEEDGAVFVFRRAKVSEASLPFVEYGDLDSWQPALHGVDQVQISVEENGFGPGVNRVSVKVPRTAGRLFLRLNANQ